MGGGRLDGKSDKMKMSTNHPRENVKQADGY